MMPRLGFNNTYAIAVRRETANLLKGKTIGALGGQEDLKVVFSHEFLERPDGWNGLSRRYGLSFSVSGIEHGLAYRALADGVIDVTDAYSTDGELERYDLVLLNDSLSFFPTYFAVPLVRASWASDKENASILRVIEKLSGEIDDATMRSLNAQVVSEGITYQRVARAFVLQKGFVAETGDPTGTGSGGSGTKLKAEISKESFVRGVVGMKHAINDLDSADSQFFIITGPAKHLDNKYSIWGRVIYGMEFVDLLKPGAPPKQPDTIQKMRVASDVK